MFIELRKDQCGTISGTYLLKQINKNNTIELSEKISKHLNYIHEQIKKNEISYKNSDTSQFSIEYIGIRNPTGKMIFCSKNCFIGTQKLIPKNKIIRQNSIFLGLEKDSSLNKNVLLFQAAITNDKNEFTGIVELALKTNHLEDICEEDENGKKNGEVLLMRKADQDVEFLYKPKNFYDKNKISLKDLKLTPFIVVLNNKQGVEIFNDFRGEKVLNVWQSIPDLNWILSTQISTKEAFYTLNQLKYILFLICCFILLTVYIFAHFISKSFTKPILNLSTVFQKISKGEKCTPLKLYHTVELKELAVSANETISFINEIINKSEKIGKNTPNILFPLKSENDKLSAALQKMSDNLTQLRKNSEDSLWLESSLRQINESVLEAKSIEEIAKILLNEISLKTQINIIVFYLFKAEKEQLIYIESRSVSASSVPQKIAKNEGLIGQIIVDKRKVHLPAHQTDKLSFVTSISKSEQIDLLLLPLIYKNELFGVLELAKTTPYTFNELKFFDELSTDIASSLSNAIQMNKIQDLLEESQSQAEELGAQTEELQQQTHLLLASEEELKAQQEELLIINHELEKQRELIQDKAVELEKISNYKSEFLANMSHELRTPLNSILLLSKLLQDNNEKNLTVEQKEFAQIINESGNNLLHLINDILDLSKIESGFEQLQLEETSLPQLCKGLDQVFSTLSQQKQLIYTCIPKSVIPETIITDGFKLDQILKNLLSNSLKFTENGHITLEVSIIDSDEVQFLGFHYNKMLCFKVEDSGIGIPKEKIQLIFSAFQQADGTTKRKYGGTGLGLTISKKLAQLLGGDLFVESEEGKGSTFSLYIPFDEEVKTNINNEKKKEIEFTDIKHKNILLVEDNKNQALALKYFLENSSFTCFIADNEKDIKNIFLQQKIDAIILDLHLPDIDSEELMKNISKEKYKQKPPIIVYTGNHIKPVDEKNLRIYAETIVIKTVNSYHRLIEELFALLKHNFNTNQIKISTYEQDENLKGKSVLVVDDDIRNIYSVTKLLEKQQIKVLSALSGIEALQMLEQHPEIELILMDMMMPEMDGYESIPEIRKLEQWKNIPIIALTAKVMKEDKEKCMEVGASDYLAKPVNELCLLALIRLWVSKNGE
ncbi:MAG: response regulator [Flavobacteriia bacterium]|nr:response regulator [Flavobacteriia bacterium]